VQSGHEKHNKPRRESERIGLVLFVFFEATINRVQAWQRYRFIMRNLNWLAPFPKSGNTWVRMFVAAYLSNDASFELKQVHNFSRSESLFSIFAETSTVARSGRLFRHGVSGRWRETLTTEQAARVVEHHREAY
jgi:hypothetical protein